MHSVLYTACTTAKLVCWTKSSNRCKSFAPCCSWAAFCTRPGSPRLCVVCPLRVQVNCKTQRSASGWARRYTSIIRTKFSSFVTSVLANRKGSVCYAPWKSLKDTGKDISEFSRPQQAETPQWFGVLCSRTLAPFSDRRPAGTVGIGAVLPITVASAVMFRGT